MLRNCCIPAILILALCFVASPCIGEAVETPQGVLNAARLRCEYRVEPLGVDTLKPELSWIVQSDARGQSQTAYRVLVASSKEKLQADTGDLWDSGKVSSDETYGIFYSGQDLRAHQACYWKVMVWDQQRRASDWSPTATWSMGVLDPEQWQGAWIGWDAQRHLNSDPPAAPLLGARWICHPKDKLKNAPANSRRVYLGIWDLPDTLGPAEASLTICADDSSIVLINGIEVARTQETFQPMTEEVGVYLRPGLNTIRVLCKNNAQGPTGLCLMLVRKDRNGPEYVLTTDDRWFCLADNNESWKTRSFDDAPNVRVQGPFGVRPWGLPAVHRDVSAPPSYLRSEFQVPKRVRRATVYLASLGWADLSINGQLVNQDYFSSGWTDYRKRVYYRAYDVTDMLQTGANAWGAILADGWYSGHIAWGAQRDFYGVKPRFRAMIQTEYEDGTTEVFATDRSWVATEGPRKLADPLVGEEYDANAEAPGWDKPGKPDVVLGRADIGAEVAPSIQWHPAPPVVEVGEFPAQTVNQPLPGVYVFDTGQNLAGIAKIKVRGRKGQRIQIRYAERLNPDGTLYVTNLRLARCVDFYTCHGEGQEVWQPRQTFHGFQYVELTGLDYEPDTDAVTAVALSSDTPLASDFDCSDPNINRLYKNVLWTQRSNFIDIPTDCPQRDERLGWTGDAQVYVRTACRATDVQTFFRKWLTDLTDAQRGDGQFPKVAPVIPSLDDGGPAWSDAGVICPWEAYQAYGDLKLLERQYPSMVRFVEFCRSRSKDEVLPPRNFHTFGDWLSVKADTPREIIYTAYYARSVDLLQQTAEVLGKQKDAAEYADLLSRIKQAFNDEYVDDDGHVFGKTQCSYVLAISYGLIDDHLRQKAAEHLVADIKSRGWKLSTGFIGTKDLMLTLAEINRNDVALKLLHQPEYPGWMFSISHGATSIWERWDGWTPESGFQDPSMNSFAHYSFGAVYGWMVEYLGGIRNAEPGFGAVVIEPTFDPELTHCRVMYDSIRGPIETGWRTKAGQRQLTVTVPANMDATLRIKGQSVKRLRLDRKPLAAAGLGAKDAAGPDGAAVAVVPLPSGKYVFTMPE